MSTRAQRFSGKTAEEAVLKAIEALGEDAEVVDAQRVKRPGLAGLFGGEVVVVTARPRVRNVIDDDDAVIDLTEPRPLASRLPSRFSADDLAPLPDPTAPAVRVVDGPPDAVFSLAPAPPLPSGIAVAANPAVIDLRSHARQRARATRLAAPPPPPPPPPAPPLPAPSRSVVDLVGKGDGTVRWGRAELRAIGVPERVLSYLPAKDPISDTIWTHSLETAIWWTLRKHRSRTNLVVDGYGPEGAMALLEAVLEGHVIRYLHLGDRTVDATPAELAKAIRSCLPR